MAPVVIDQTCIAGSHCDPFEPELMLIADGKLQLAPLISATYNSEQADDAFAASAQSDVFNVRLVTRQCLPETQDRHPGAPGPFH